MTDQAMLTSDNFMDTENSAVPRVLNNNFAFDKHRTVNFTKEAFTILGSLEYGSYNYAKDLALNPVFISSNQSFVKEGEIIRLCISKGYLSLAQDLLKAGYSIPDDILLKAIEHHQADIINAIISSGIYNRSEVVLEYWFLVYSNYIYYAEKLLENEPSLNEYLGSDALDASSYSLIKAALKSSLERKYDDLSATILKLCPNCIDIDLIDIALSKSSLCFLRKVWTGDLEDIRKDKTSIRVKNNPMLTLLNASDYEKEKNRIKEVLDIGYILRYLLQRKMIVEAKQVLLWPGAANGPNVLRMCILLKEEELGKKVISRRKQPVKRSDFELSFTNHCYWLCLDMLRWKEARTYLFSSQVQKELLKLLEKGETCYFAAEMISVIDLKYWHAHHTKDLCEGLMHQLKKTDEIVKCPYPLLYLVLLAEFLRKIGNRSVLYSRKCERTIHNLLLLCKCIEDTITEELELKYFLYTPDSQGRTVLTILALNGFYSLLENNDVGSIIHNLWIGDRKNYGLMPASTLYSSFRAGSGSEDELLFLQKMNMERPYVFQYEQLECSSQLRLVGQTISTILLVFFYTMAIHSATVAGAMDEVARDPTAEGFLRISQVWIFGLFLEKVLALIFAAATRRRSVKDPWIINDFLICLATAVLMGGATQRYAGPGNALYFVTAAEFNTILYGFVLCLIWLRFFSVLLTSITYGPLLQMMFNMVKAMGVFLVLFLGVMAVGATIMSCLFASRTSSGEFDSFGMSFLTMFSASLGSLDLTLFTEYLALGGVVQACFTMVLNIMMLNILIGLLSMVYDREHEGEETRFRANIALEHYKWNWDQDYGLLIMLPAPISIICTFIAPFLFLAKVPRTVCRVASKVLFFVYVLPIFAYFAAVSAVYAPMIYFTSMGAFARGGVKKAKAVEVLKLDTDDSDSDEDEEVIQGNIRIFSLKRAVVWVVIGWVFCLIAYFRDLFHFWSIVYKEVDQEVKEPDTFTINPETIKIIQSVMKSVNSQECKLDEFISRYCLFESSTRSRIQLADNAHQERREKSIREFFEYWISSARSEKIRISHLKLLVPVLSYYPDCYITRVNHIRIQWIYKALKYYMKNSTTVKMEDISIPKYITENETRQIKDVLRNTKKLKNSSMELKLLTQNLPKLSL